MSISDTTIKRVKCVRFSFEAEPLGYGVDPVTHIGTPAEKKIDEERLIVSLVIDGEKGERIVDEKYASAIYEEVWKFLNEQKS